MTVAELSLPPETAPEDRRILSRMQLHVYRLTDDDVPVVVISSGPLPPPGGWGQPARELLGVYDSLTDAREAAFRAREASRPIPSRILQAARQERRRG